MWLLIASYFFYMNWNATYALLILSSTIITFCSSLLIRRYENNKKLFLSLCIVSNLGILFFYKYYNFAADVVTSLLVNLHIDLSIDRLDVLLPVGISFYTFQAISYTIDVYKKRVETEKSFLKYALFVSFFPQLVAGPIERSSHLLPQFSNLKSFNYGRFKSGMLLMAWGMFKKVMIADQLAIYVNEVYNQPADHFGTSIIIATVMFAVQIYCDFSGYSDIAIGCARTMGFDLMKNFNNPYFSKSITEFWHRWHISLSTWFKDYLYIPLGGNKKGLRRTYINIFIVFVVSGLWHGAAATFILWGAIHGVIIILERVFMPLSNKIYDYLNWNRNNFSFKLFKNIFVLIIVCFAWLFFRANTISEAFILLKNMIVFDGGFEWYEKLPILNIFYFSLISLFLVEYANAKFSLIEKLNKQHIVLRWGVYIGLILITLIFGTYGQEEASFLYFQF